MDYKVCTKCKEEKEITSFYKMTSSKDGFSYQCKTCIKQYTDKYTTLGISKERQKIKSRKDNLKGQCSSCKRERLSTSKFCLYHFVYSIVNVWKLPKDKLENTIQGLIEKLEFSEYTCHYSGLKITPGFSASVDHRIAKSRGGTHDLSNLVWCHRIINSMKCELSEKEFINRSANILVELNYLDSKGQL